MTTRAHRVAVIVLAALCAAHPGCGTTRAQQQGSAGAAIGAGVGALFGGWQGAAIGALAGGGTGYLVGNDQDRRKAEIKAANERAAIQPEFVMPDPSAPAMPKANPLVGTSWQVLSVVNGMGRMPDHRAMVVTFPTARDIVTVTVLADGTTETTRGTYRVQDRLLIITESGGEEINTSYLIQDETMTVTKGETRVILEQVEEDS